MPSSKQHWLLRLLGSEPEFPSQRRWMAEARRVGVPCRPTVEVLQLELGSRLLLAALLACRDAGHLQLRLAEPRGGWARVTDPPPSRVRVAPPPLPSARVAGLCGRIVETLGRTGEQDARKLLRATMGDFYAEWVIAQVEAELVDLGYLRPRATPWWRPTGDFQRVVADCDLVGTLAEECAQAVDRWRWLTLADQQLCDALLADCTDAITPPTPPMDDAWV